MLSLRDVLKAAGGEEVNVIDFDGEEFGIVGLHGGKENMVFLTKYGDCPVLDVSRRVGRKANVIILSLYEVNAVGEAQKRAR